MGGVLASPLSRATAFWSINSISTVKQSILPRPRRRYKAAQPSPCMLLTQRSAGP